MDQAKIDRKYGQLPVGELQRRSEELSELAKTGQISGGLRIARRRVKNALEKKQGSIAYAHERQDSEQYHSLFDAGYGKGKRDGLLGLRNFASDMDDGPEREGYVEGYTAVYAGQSETAGRTYRGPW